MIKKNQCSFCMISLSELNDIKNIISPVPTKNELRKSVDENLRKVSLKKVNGWKNSTENLNKARLEAQKRKFIDDEMIRRKIDEEEKKYQDLQNSMIINRAKEAYFNSQDPVKSFISKMQYSDMLNERKLQLKQNEAIRQRNQAYDNYLLEKERENLRKQDEEEERKKQLRISKMKEEMKIIKDQYDQCMHKRIQEIQDDNLEGTITKMNALKAIKEEEEIKRKNIEKSKALNEEFKKSNEEIKKLMANKKLKEIEEDKLIELHAQRKQELEDLKKRKEKEKFEEKQKRQQQIIDVQVENLRKINEMKSKLEQKDIEIKQKKDEEEDKNKKQKMEKLLKDIEDNRLLYLENKKKAKEQEKLIDLKQLEEWRKQLKEQQDLDKKIYLENKKKQKDLYDFQLRQSLDKRINALRDFNNSHELAFKNKMLIIKEDDDFIKFAEKNIQEYEKQGKDILPMLLELKKYKIRNKNN